MKIGVIQASSQIEKNETIFQIVKEKAKQHEVINFGCFAEEKEKYSYIEISIEVGLLIASGAVDFIVTGCSSGQGMMLACNNMPGVICGYAPTPQDAYLFGRINDGNAISLPLGLNYGWAGEMNVKYIMDALFSEPFGNGYPKEDAKRKMSDTKVLKDIEQTSHIDIVTLLDKLDEDLICKVLSRKNIVNYIVQNGTNKNLIEWLIKQN